MTVAPTDDPEASDDICAQGSYNPRAAELVLAFGLHFRVEEDDAMDRPQRNEADRQEERRVNPPGLGKLEHERPAPGGEADLDKKTENEDDSHD